MTLQQLQDERDIRRIIYRYCRAVDRSDFALLRSCYHPDAFDDHGVYKGGVDGLLDYIRGESGKFLHTMHFIGNVLIDIDGDTADTEAYTLAFHRMPASPTKPLRDLVVGLRYLDRFERRTGRWAIARRVCVFAWSQRTDVDQPAFDFSSVYVMSATWPHDPVYSQ